VKYAIFIVVTHKDKMSEQQIHSIAARIEAAFQQGEVWGRIQQPASNLCFYLPGYPMDNTRSDDNENRMWLCTSLI
jgi:hypothetical protein